LFLLPVGCSSEADKLEKRAETGDVEAQFALGALYEMPDKGQPDLVRACQWYTIAAANGDVAASEYRVDCTGKMSASQVKQAQALADAWLKKHPPKVAAKNSKANTKSKTKAKAKPKPLPPAERIAAEVRVKLGKPPNAKLTPADWKKVSVLHLDTLNAQKLRDLSPLAQCAGLRELDVGSNGLANLAPLANLTNLEIFMGYENRIVDLAPLAKAARMRELRLSGNPTLKNLLPLANLTRLEVLELGGCAVVDLAPLARHTQLHRLVLTSNQVTDVTPLHGLAKLRFLSIKHCPVPPAQVAALRKALPDCKIFGP